MSVTEAVDDWEGELKEVLEEIRTGIKGLNKIKSTDEREKKVALLQKRIKRAKDVLKQFKIEVRSLPKTAPGNYQQKMGTYSDDLNTLITDLNWAHKNSEEPKNTQRNLDTMSSDNILKRADDTQKRSQNTLENIIRTLEETKQKGSAIASALSEHTHRMQGIEKNLDEMKITLQVARKQVRDYARRLATDKMFLVLIALIVVGILFLIIWTATHAGKLASPPVDKCC